MSADELPPLLRQRRESLGALRARGIDPFGTRFPVSHWAGDLKRRLGEAPEDELKAFGPVGVAGRLVALRHHGKTCFAHLMDYTGRIQLYARADQLGDDYALFTGLDVGDFVGVTGEPFRTPHEVHLPMKSRGKLVGVLACGTDAPNALDDEDVAVLQTLANLVATAFEIYEAQVSKHVSVVRLNAQCALKFGNRCVI